MRAMTRTVFLAAAILLSTVAAKAADGWGIENEKEVEVEATVVDIACQLTGDCPENCGGGKRQLGLLTGDGKLRAAVKATTLFAGPHLDLLPYCGRKVFADGLLIENPAMTIFMVQNLRDSKDEKLRTTDAFQKDWTARNGKAEEWMRADPAVKKVIAEKGVLGIKGLEPPK